MSTTDHPSAGLDKSKALFRAQRLDEINAPHRVHSHLAVALDIAASMDEHDSELASLARVLVQCAKAICAAIDHRT